MTVPHLPPLTFGPGAADYQQRIDVVELRSQRAQRARDVLTEHGVAVTLVAGAPACRYLTGLKGQEVVPDSWYVLFPVEGDTVVFQQSGYVPTMSREAPWIKEWRFARSLLRGLPGAEAARVESAKFAKEIRAELERMGLLGEKLALVGIGSMFREALTAEGIEVTAGEDLILEAMAAKTEEELKCMRMAGAITDRMWGAMTRAAHVGISDYELSAVGKAAGISGGADSVNAVFRSGPLTSERGFKGGNQFIVPGDLMYGLVCGTSFLGYRTCVYRTFVVGREATKLETEWMTKLEERLLAVIAELKPGNLTSDAAKHFPPADTWGYSDEVQVLTAEIGHGIGLHAYEQPVVNRQWSLDHPQELKAGMVVAVEGREGIIGERTVRLEQMVVITDDGPQLIDRYPTGITPVG